MGKCRQCLNPLEKGICTCSRPENSRGADPETTYYKNLCIIQKELIEKMHDYIHRTDPNRPKSLDDATPREWDLGARCWMLEQDNNQLRELANEYRNMVREYQNAAN